MTLEKIFFIDNRKGINVSAFTDAYSYDLGGQIALLSICGHDSSVRAISSAVITGDYVAIKKNEDIEITCGVYNKHRIFSSKLAGGLLHQLVINDMLFGVNQTKSILIYLKKEEDFYKTFFLKIKQRFTVPMIKEWSEWLYKRLCRESMVEEFSGNVKIIKITVEETSLEEIITEGIKQKEISF